MKGQLTPEEFIDETVAFYTQDTKRRAVGDDGKSMYHTPDGRMCAIGRCVGAPASFQYEYGRLAVNAIPDIRANLRPEYRGIPLRVLEDVQAFHDWPEYWDADGLSQDGLDYLPKMKSRLASEGDSQ